ncbi:DNA-processing protein DprA [Actinoplanes sp. CA-030573]|uniref:DNA-processing protein DprA n=1 Tax=Actinoplanes sp. CA-030573 TaxID=3239898 RepID=UPI003D926F61
MPHSIDDSSQVDYETRVAYVALATFAPYAWPFEAVTSEGPSVKLAELPASIAALHREAASAMLHRADRLGIRAVVPGDDEWPQQIADLNHDNALRGAPLCLWVRGTGRLSDVLRRSVMITGAAAANDAGKQLARQIGWQLGDGPNGWTVANGGRFGIDEAATNGASIAADRSPRMVVLAHGLDLDRGLNRPDFYSAVAAEGLLVSVVPLGCEQSRSTRLGSMETLAALTSATVVIEAPLRSLCLAGARRAAAMRRPVLAIPGAEHDAKSAGGRQLIADGTARPVTDGPGVITALARIA